MSNVCGASGEDMPSLGPGGLADTARANLTYSHMGAERTMSPRRPQTPSLEG
jgi:hypothetical protein